jgi:subtilisin family serine protease/plastocyanin
MSEREYIVSLNAGADYNAFNAEMIAGTGKGDIPHRSVDVANARPASKRNTHYNLTDEEAALLKNDSRVYGVTLLPELDPDLAIGFSAVQSGNFTKTTSDSGDFLNWGMRRINEETNPYSGLTTTGGYNYTLDGTGVDIVIQDSGIQADHPEFTDASGASRVQQIDWTAESGIAGMPAQSANYYRDFDGHGTHVAGTAAGKTYGWAKNAKIYSLKVAGLEGSGDSGTGTSATYAFDCIKEWHLAKPVDPTTGARRPTVVNMSWGYLRYYDSVTSMTYRGVSKTGADIDTTTKRWDFGLPPTNNGFRYTTNTRIASVDVDMEELIEAGVHVMVAAGNRSHKVDVEGGADYDNVLVANTGSVNYQRGSSPYSVNAHIVGNVDSSIHSGGLEQKASSSETGPGVSVFAPGTDIMSAVSTTNRFTDGDYPGNSSFKITNISGTSMASPQIAGLLGLWLQLNPGATPAEGLQFIKSKAKSSQLYDSDSNNDYTDTRSLLGSTAGFAFNKFNSATQLTMGTISDTVAGANPTYALTSNLTNVNEGNSVTISLATTNIANGTDVAYVISGVTTDDISESLSGNFTVTDNAATLTINVTADATTEGAETMVVTLVGIGTSVSVTINDTSLTPAVPTYTATPAANEVNEGSTLTVNVATTNVADATTLYWTVSQPDDFAVSSGSFVINSNAGSFTVSPGQDIITEGAETFTASVRLISTSGTIVATTTDITINDTSQNPAGTVYDVTVASGTNEYGTGNKYYIGGFVGPSPILNLIEGSTYTFKQNDVSNATHQLLFSTTPNGTHAGGTEFTTGVTKVGTAGSLGAYTKIIVPTSTPTLYYYCINHPGMGGTANTPDPNAPTYDSIDAPTNANEGDVVTFTVNTQNVGDATTVGYTITGITNADLSVGSLTGNITISSNTGAVAITLAQDSTTEGSETMTLTLDATDSGGNSTGSLTAQTVIADTSLNPTPTYDATPAANNINEGSPLTINVATTNVADATTLYWSVTNASDFATSTGSFVINSDAGSFTVTPTADTTTEGAESFQVQIRTGSTSGTVVDTSDAITINDTSQSPAFNPDYTITVTNSGNSYILSGTDRNGAVSGSNPALAFNSGDNVRFNVNASTSSAHPFYIKTTQSTGTGNQVTGATGQGTTQVDWTTATDGAGSYGYQCSIHFGMWNTITIS